jgi:ELWxxDGT repeat protein
MRFGGTPGRPTSAGGYALFVAQKAVSPFSLTLFRTDGTEAGTQPILEVYDANSQLYLGPEVARIGGRTFFLAEGLQRRLGFELWMTDGTAAGTLPVLSDPTSPDPNAPRPRQLQWLTVFKDALYFTANTGDPARPRGIWRSDGTAAGTRLLKALGPQPPQGPSLFPTFTPAGDRLFFRLDDGVHGTELWRTDGTPEGTALVRDIAPGPKDASIGSLASGGVASGKVYFSATDGEHGLELWESDGTAAGTRLVQDIAPGTASSNPEQIVATGDKLFFTADDGAHGRELWELPLP